MKVLAASAKIDRRFARRFPDRSFWLRPATPEERRVILARKPDAASFSPAYLCIAIAHRDCDFLAFPFWATCADVSGASDGDAAEFVMRAAEAIAAGGMASIILGGSMTPAEQRFKAWEILKQCTSENLPLKQTSSALEYWFVANGIGVPRSFSNWFAEVPKEWWRDPPCRMVPMPVDTKLYHYFNRGLIDSIRQHGLLPSNAVRDHLGMTMHGAHYIGLLWFTHSDFPPDLEQIPCWLWKDKIDPKKPGDVARVVIDESKLSKTLIYMWTASPR